MADFLAIDTSSRYLTVAARKGEKTVVRHLPECEIGRASCRDRVSAVV